MAATSAVAATSRSAGRRCALVLALFVSSCLAAPPHVSLTVALKAGEPPFKSIDSIPYFEGETGFDAMLLAQGTTPRINMSWTDYPGLGVLISAIDGIGGDPGAYWHLSVNNVSSDVGISARVLKDGDEIEWDYVS